MFGVVSFAGGGGHQGPHHLDTLHHQHRCDKLLTSRLPCWQIIIRSLAGAAGANKAAATKMFHDNQAAGVYTFNPNSGLRPAAGANFAVTSAPVLRLFQTFGPIDKSVVVLDY